MSQISQSRSTSWLNEEIDNTSETASELSFSMVDIDAATTELEFDLPSSSKKFEAIVTEADAAHGQMMAAYRDASSQKQERAQELRKFREWQSSLMDRVQKLAENRKRRLERKSTMSSTSFQSSLLDDSVPNSTLSLPVAETETGSRSDLSEAATEPQPETRPMARRNSIAYEGEHELEFRDQCVLQISEKVHLEYQVDPEGDIPGMPHEPTVPQGVSIFNSSSGLGAKLRELARNKRMEQLASRSSAPTPQRVVNNSSSRSSFLSRTRAVLSTLGPSGIPSAPASRSRAKSEGPKKAHAATMVAKARNALNSAVKPSSQAFSGIKPPSKVFKDY